MTLSALQAVAHHLRSNAVRTDGPFKLSSGKFSDWYLDARQTTFSGEGARLVGAAIWPHVEDADAVGGMTMGADPIAVATAIHAASQGTPLRAFSIRTEAKAHGTGGRLVGPVRAGDRVVMLEDTVTTGGTLLDAIEVAQSADLEVMRVVVLVDRSRGAAGRLFSERGIPYIALLRPEDLGVSQSDGGGAS